MILTELGPEHRPYIWQDRDGDYWMFDGDQWRYRRPGSDDRDWEPTESDWEPEPRYGPFQTVSHVA